MRLDVARIEERIAKLQEIKRIASDPEMARILLEFLVPDQEAPASVAEMQAREEINDALQMQPRKAEDTMAAAQAGDSEEDDEAAKLLSAIAQGRDSKSPWRMRRG